jgi:hypothetical protein
MITNKYSSDHNILVGYHKGQTVVIKDSSTAIGKLVLHFKAIPKIKELNTMATKLKITPFGVAKVKKEIKTRCIQSNSFTGAQKLRLLEFAKIKLSKADLEKIAKKTTRRVKKSINKRKYI